jgi:hypothetical protein
MRWTSVRDWHLGHRGRAAMRGDNVGSCGSGIVPFPASGGSVTGLSVTGSCRGWIGDAPSCRLRHRTSGQYCSVSEKISDAACVGSAMSFPSLPWHHRCRVLSNYRATCAQARLSVAGFASVTAVKGLMWRTHPDEGSRGSSGVTTSRVYRVIEAPTSADDRRRGWPPTPGLPIHVIALPAAFNFGR